MGLSEDELRVINPQAIFCQLDCFSRVDTGPRSNYLGYDDLVQATTGIMLRFGGSMDTPEEHAHVGTIDVMCGFAASMGIATALYRKYRTGHIGRVKTSLTPSSGLAQLPSQPRQDPSAYACREIRRLDAECPAGMGYGDPEIDELIDAGIPWRRLAVRVADGVCVSDPIGPGFA